jgi:hypothetical protein
MKLLWRQWSVLQDRVVWYGSSSTDAGKTEIQEEGKDVVTLLIHSFRQLECDLHTATVTHSLYLPTPYARVENM